MNDSRRSIVLLVEDEPMLRQVVAMTLKVDGFDVIEAGDGDEALGILRSDNPIDVLLTDVRMPGLNGYQLAEASRSVRPQLPVILMTGFADEDVPDAIRKPAIPMIRKPFNFAELSASVRKMMQR